ncbi:Nucleotide-binding, alpha-beta plait [Artemisia annua]|uniref:Nucleotide-binding, alpha-beta plait n=1 Tax=Artemisia annua TaxID=35608 RepID=A0A2U1N3M7_ARTAN|nr:Nucleotide-binding, alpha-beta plait [Artemisia annua]
MTETVTTSQTDDQKPGTLENMEDREPSAAEQLNAEGVEEGLNDDDEWEYVEEGPPEIIWQGNEIIVKKNKVRVKKKDTSQDFEKEDTNRPTSNPLPPQSEAYASYKNAPITSTELVDTVAQQVPNFGTEQDKAHCPFHIKTGACRFGLRCNRVHYYPDKSTTLLIKNMYNGPGLAWEQDEGLEYTEEEVERSYEDFYEDVHTEFLKFGEIVNFKVCRNGSFHLRGNVYVHYKSLDSAVMAYNSVQGRYFAGKQVKCEFVCLTRWKVAICGEYVKSRLKTCSRGSACNFLHCFSNPGGDYEWADSDKPPPRYWVEKMTALFGYSDDPWHDKQIDQPSPKDHRHSSRVFTSDRESHHYKRHQSVETNKQNGSSSRSRHEENRAHKNRHHEHQNDDKYYDDERKYRSNHRSDSVPDDTVSDRDLFDKNTHRRHRDRSKDRSRHSARESKPRDYYGSSSDEDLYTEKRRKSRSRHRKENDDEKADDAKHEDSEAELQRHRKQKTSSTRYNQRSRRHNRDEGVDDHRESEDERYANKQKRHKRKSATDKNNTNDRWEPDSSPIDHGNDYELSDVRKSNDKRSSREIGSGSVDGELEIFEVGGKDRPGESRHSHDRDDRTREKRKRI